MQHRFAGREHRDFYIENIKRCRYQDVYHQALIYTLGISPDTRMHVNSIYDFNTGCVKHDCIHEGWITSGSVKVIRLAFNLYCNGAPTTLDINEKDTRELTREYRAYLPDELFCCSYAPFFWEAIKIRYPEYCLE